MNRQKEGPMEFLLWFAEREGAPRDVPDCIARMDDLSRELASERKLRRGAPLTSVADAALVRVRDGKAFVSDGPYAEAKEVVAGFWIVDVASREEAIAIARRSSAAAWGTAEVHPIALRLTYKDTEAGTPFLFVFRQEPGLEDCDGAKLAEMIAFSDELGAQGILLETAPLKSEPPPARIEVRRGKALVTDGPFAESREGVGGYGVVRLKDRAAAIELAKRYPHARWGPVEIREIQFFDPV
jgi:hypothetical protein